MIKRLDFFQMIDVIEGTTVNLKIIGNRVAFSIYGNVNSLNSDGKFVFSGIPEG